MAPNAAGSNAHPESASPVAGGAVDAARAGNCVGCWRILRFGVGVCGVGGRAAVRAATADGRLARGQIPLRHAGADLDVYGHVSVAAGGSGDGSVAHSSICETWGGVSHDAGRRRGARPTYALSHCAIHPAGSLGSVESVGPESGETGGMGGVWAAMVGEWEGWWC